MGLKDSSKTRVQPILSALLAREGCDWLPKFLSLGSRSNVVGADRLENVGQLLNMPTRTKWFEWRANAPKDYLAKLLVSPDRLALAAELSPKIAKWSKSRDVNEKRRLLMEGDRSTVTAALERLDAGKASPGRGAWWVLEGRSAIDCALFAERATIFIEGKRTERVLTKSISWDPYRNQVFRNLDALRASAAPADKDFFMLLIVEQGSSAEKEASDLDYREDLAIKSWPHLSENAGEQLFQQHYLGYTTWQVVSKTFGVPLE